MTDTLYIIGNGFDLHHGLQTSYSHFRDNYLKKYPMMWNLLEALYGHKIKDNLWWNNFEDMLAIIDFTNLKKSRNGEAMGNEKVKNFIVNMPTLFGEWIEKVNKGLCGTKIQLISDIDKDAYFFTFNYTTLLEDAYHINSNQIWHIHNSITDYIKRDINPIVGHDAIYKTLIDNAEKYIANGIMTYYTDTINQELEKGAKKVLKRIEANKDKFEQYASIQHFIIMGFSINDIDLPYIEKIIQINQNISKTDWTIYWHTEGESNRMKAKLNTIGIEESQISFIQW